MTPPQTPSEADGKLHEHALITADMAREGWTDCSTPLFQRVRNALSELRSLRAAAEADANDVLHVYSVSGQILVVKARTAAEAETVLLREYQKANAKRAEIVAGKFANLPYGLVADITG